VEQVRRELPELAHSADVYCWIACEAKSTRALTTFARKEIGIPEDRLHSMAYWRA
jgi:NADPH-dependent ferric siderophore reductase